MLNRNSVFEISRGWSNAPFVGLCRFLAADGEGLAALIEIPPSVGKSTKPQPVRAPVVVSVIEFLHQIDSGNIKEVQCTPAQVNINTLSKAAKKKVEQRKKIIGMMTANDELIFNPLLMLEKIRDCAKTNGVSDRNVRRILYDYYAGGQNEFALIPQFQNCGGPAKEQKPGTAKCGRKSTSPHSKSRVALPIIRKQLQEGIEKHYLPGKKTIHQAFVDTLKDHFRRKDADLSSEQLSDILVPEDLQPSIWQFRHMIRKIEKENGKRLAIPGRMRQLPKVMESRGLATDHVLGPGHRFEIDASKLQIQLVSRYGRTKLVGTPSLYIIVDVWSSAIVGYCISHENFSWTMAASALSNAFSEKQKLFERLGMSYTNDDWPCHHLPSNLMADRAELITDKSKNVPNIGINVEIAAAMCPEMKGTVEEKFSEIKHKHPYRLPGKYAKGPGRREKDGKDDAVLTIDELEKILVEIILDLNNQPVAHTRIPPAFIEDGETNISRIGLYAWGIKSKPGFTRMLSEEEYKYYLLTPDSGSLSPSGIRFKSQIFRPERSLSSLLADKISRVDIRYYEHDVRTIYFHNEKTQIWEPAHNTNQHITKPLAFYEYDFFRKNIEGLSDGKKKQVAHEISLKERVIDQIINTAKKETSQEKTVARVRKSKRAIRENKTIEKMVQRHLHDEEPQVIPVIEKSSPVKALSALSEKSVAEIAAELWEGQ